MKRKTYTLLEITRACKAYRNFILHEKQSTVANDTGYSPLTISSFENGRNDNLRIFMWYIDRGFTIDYIEKYLKGVESLVSIH